MDKNILLEEIENLANEMNRVANLMMDYAECNATQKNKFIKHANELIGASQLTHEWAFEISGSEDKPPDDPIKRTAPTKLERESKHEQNTKT